MSDIERFEEDMRKVVADEIGICETCVFHGRTRHRSPCDLCDVDNSEYKWHGRKTSIAEAVNEAGEDVKPDPVNRPAYYTQGGIECIDAMNAAFGGDAVKDFCLCNCFKYLWRHRQKNGVEDLKKARWYLDRLIRDVSIGME